MNKWQKILLGVSAGLFGLASFIPGAAVITIPLLGKTIAVATAIQAAGAFAAGVAMKTPGHVQANVTNP